MKEVYCRVNTSRRRVLLPTSFVLSALPCVLYNGKKHVFALLNFFFITISLAQTCIENGFKGTGSRLGACAFIKFLFPIYL